jgi:hypothetical protein
VAGKLDAEDWQSFRAKLTERRAAAEAEAEQLRGHAAEIDAEAAAFDADREAAERLAALRDSVAGEVTGADGLGAVRAGLARVFEKITLVRTRRASSSSSRRSGRSTRSKPGRGSQMAVPPSSPSRRAWPCLGKNRSENPRARGRPPETRASSRQATSGRPGFCSPRTTDVDELRRLVAEAGLRVAALEDVPILWRAASLEEWWLTIRDLSRMLSTLLERLTPEEGQAVRDGAGRRLSQYVAEDGSLEVPGLARVVLAVRDG